MSSKVKAINAAIAAPLSIIIYYELEAWIWFLIIGIMAAIAAVYYIVRIEA